MQTLQHIPIWVFALLIGLIVLGLLQTRTRQVRKSRLLGIMAPDLLQSLQAAIGISALYGLFSGVLNSRAWRLLQLKETA